MGRIVGIDLGTTYSAVAIPEERQGEGFLTVPGCPGCSVILDANKRRITPSVVAEDQRGQIVVGHTAKGRAGLSPEPIMFSKRWMGEDKTFPLAKQGALRPEQAAGHILRYLKEMAETRLKEKVDEAVITVPAYFTLQAKQKTEEAGRLAGLKVAQIAQEPVAAALMYCAGDPRESLRIMTYDLGGGTFDVAILEKRDGVISTQSIRAFDGDRFLGGYNFDQILAWWMVKQLQKSYSLELNLENPADKIRFAKFMVYAERAKVALSQAEDFEIQDPASGLQDHAGRDIELLLTLTRGEFEDMIRKHIEDTIQLCHRAREKCNPPLKKEQFDEILMVGGSSRIPLVGRRLQEEFGKKPKLLEPDLCVALGAAILAGTKAQTIGCLKLDPIPAQTELPRLTVTGAVVPGPNLPGVAGCAVNLKALDGSYGSKRTIQADGRFAFPDVPLAAEVTRKFALTVQSPRGTEVASHRFEVRQSAAAAGLVEVEAATNVLSKPIGLWLVDGLEVIAAERTPLPYQTVVRAKTTDTSGTIRVPIHEENNQLGEIVMQNIPTDLPVGTSVEVTVSIQPNYQVTGRAVIPSLNREEKVEIRIPVVKVPGRPDLEQRHTDLSRRANDALTTAGRGAVFGDPKVKRLKQLLADTRDMLQAPSPDLSRINDQLDEVDGLVRRLGAGWKPDPPRAAFEQKCSEAEDLLAEVIRHQPEKAKDGYDRRLAAFKTEAGKAETAQNSAAWKDAFQKVCKLCEELEGYLPRSGGGAEVPPDPNMLLINLAQSLRNLADHARERGVFEKFKADFKEVGDALRRIDPKAPDAMNQIRDWYYTRFEDLRKRLEAPEQKGLLELEKKG